MSPEFEALAKVLEISELPLEEQQKLIASFSEVALKAATAAVLEKMPEAKREEFAQLAEQGDAARLTALLAKEVPEHEALAGEAVRRELTSFKTAIATPS